VTVEIPDHGVRARFYDVAYSDEEVLAACRVGGGRVLDFQVVDGVDHDAGLVRLGTGR
jgi:hypothetical protein